MKLMSCHPIYLDTVMILHDITHLEALGGGFGDAAKALQVEADAALGADGGRVLLQRAHHGILDLPQHVHAVPCEIGTGVSELISHRKGLLS